MDVPQRNPHLYDPRDPIALTVTKALRVLQNIQAERGCLIGVNIGGLLIQRMYLPPSSVSSVRSYLRALRLYGAVCIGNGRWMGVVSTEISEVTPHMIEIARKEINAARNRVKPEGMATTVPDDSLEQLVQLFLAQGEELVGLRGRAAALVGDLQDLLRRADDLAHRQSLLAEQILPRSVIKATYR